MAFAVPTPCLASTVQPSRESVTRQRHRPSSIVANEPTGDLLSNRTRPPLFPPFPCSFYSWLLATLCFRSAFPHFSPPVLLSNSNPWPPPRIAPRRRRTSSSSSARPSSRRTRCPDSASPTGEPPSRPPPLIPRWDRFGLAGASSAWVLTRVCWCERAQGGAGADDQVQGARRGPGPRARGVLRAAVHGRRPAHLRGHHHLALRPWVIISALVCYCFRPSIHVSGDPCHHTLVLMSPSCEACAQPWAERCARDLVETWSSCLRLVVGVN